RNGDAERGLELAGLVGPGLAWAGLRAATHLVEIGKATRRAGSSCRARRGDGDGSWSAGRNEDGGRDQGRSTNGVTHWSSLPASRQSWPAVQRGDLRPMGNARAETFTAAEIGAPSRLEFPMARSGSAEGGGED